MKKGKSKILITGAGGFIGSNLARNFLKNNCEIHALLRKNTNTSRIKDILPQINIHFCDLTNKKLLKKIMGQTKPDYIFHLASYGNFPHQTELDKMIKTNVVGLLNLLDTTKDISYKSFLIAGSSSEYGFKNKPMKEKDYLEPPTYYAGTKASATLIAQAFAKTNKKPIAILRLFSVYGPDEPRTRLIPTVISQALNNKEIRLTKEKIKHDFIYIADVVEAFEKCISKKVAHGEIFNIGSGKQSSNHEVVKIIEKLLKRKLKIKIGAFPKRIWDANHWVADNSKAKKLIGWDPKFNLRSGLMETIEWTKSYEKN